MLIFLNILAGSLILLTVVLYLWAKRSFGYWKRKNVPCLEPDSLIFGHYYDVIAGNTTPGEYFRSAYDQLTPHKWGGLFVFWKPLLLVRDPSLVKNVLSNIDHFDRDAFMVNPKRPLSRHLFNLSGAQWRAMKTALMPAFSPAKMRSALGLVKTSSEGLCKVVADELRRNNFVDIADITERYCIDAMTPFIFGLQAGTLENPNSYFRQMASKQNKPNVFTAVLKEVFPRLVNVLNISTMNVDVEKFFYSVTAKAIRLKEDSANDAFHHDLISVMLELNGRELQQGIPQILKDENRDDAIFRNTFKAFDEQLMSAQCFIMFMAGFKPTSFLMNCVWLEVAKNERVQERMREEIDHVLAKYDGEICLESLHKMTFIDQVISETIRLYPVSPVLFRTCIKDYPVPNTDFIIDKGTEIAIPIYGIHHDGQYYSTPQEFNPDHFSKSSQAVGPASSFISFGEGPRQCIAVRLASMMAKVAVVRLLRQYTISLSPKMSPALKFAKYLKVMRFNNPILLHCTVKDPDAADCIR